MVKNFKCEYCNKDFSGYDLHKGIPRRFCSAKCRSNSMIGKTINKGERNGMWRGDKVSYKALHQWITSHKPKPKFCEKCRIDKPYDLANISGDYKRDINDFKWLCRRCHLKEDGRIIKNLKRPSRIIVNGKFFCNRCKKFKSREEYYKNKRNKNGICSYCKICEDERKINYLKRKRNE